MAYNFSTNSGKLIVTLDTESGKFSENINEYLQPNLVLGNDRVFLKEDGLFKQDFVFEAFGDIGGNTAENLVDAYNLLNALIIGISVNSTTQYKVYTALLTQSGTNAPVATVLENTLNGNVTFSFISTGIYEITIPVQVNYNKVFILCPSSFRNKNAGVFSDVLIDLPITTNNFKINVKELNFSINYLNSMLDKFPIEIRVYN